MMLKKLGILIMFSLFCGFIYYMFSVGKAVNYNFFYSELVTQTIQETVKQGCLK